MSKKIDFVESYIIRFFNNELEFLLLKRAITERYPEIWQPITGTIEKDEKAYIAAIREIYEETGIKVKSLKVVPRINSFYIWELDKIVQVPVFVTEVERDSKIVLSKEHTEYKWLNKNQAIELVSFENQKISIQIIDANYNKLKNTFYFSEIKF